MVHNLARRQPRTQGPAFPRSNNVPADQQARPACRMPKGVSDMATDYDAPRKTEEDQSEESIEELKARRHDKNSGKVDEDEAEAAESFELPGADLSHEELAVEVKPKQDDEFTCMSCFLVHHRSQLADEKKMICFDCAA
jgi:hypothetical protein